MRGTHTGFRVVKLYICTFATEVPIGHFTKFNGCQVLADYSIELLHNLSASNQKCLGSTVVSVSETPHMGSTDSTVSAPV